MSWMSVSQLLQSQDGLSSSLDSQDGSGVLFMFIVDNDLEHYLLGDFLGLSIFSPLEGRQDQTPVFSGSENREVRAGRHCQEGLPAPCGQVSTVGREGRDSGWRTPDSAGATLRGQSDSCTCHMSLHSRGRRTPVCSASLGLRHRFSDLL